MKRSKKNPEEDKGARKKKSKTNKRRRRDSSPSSSSSSYSSEPEDDPRAQRRQRRRKKGSTKSEKQIKESKKSGRKKSRRSSRRRISASPSGGRSSSGSSADGRRRQRRSRSPVARPERKRKSRARARSGSRGRSRRRTSGQREESRLRSPSCSTCPSRSVSSSSRGRSPVRRAKQRDIEIEKPKRFQSGEMVLRNNSDNDAERDKNIQSGQNSASLQSRDDAYEVPWRLDTHLHTSEMENSVSAVRKDGRRDDELVSEKADNWPSKKANAGDDDFTKRNENPSNSAADSVADLELILRQKALENFRKFRGGPSTNRASAAGVGNKLSETKDDPCEVVELRQKAVENHRKSRGGLAASSSIRTNADTENEASETHNDPPEVTEMRQKALENFRKSQGGISVNSRLPANREKGSDQTLSCDKLSGLVEVQNSGSAVHNRLTTSSEQQTRIHGDNRQSGRRMRSIVTIPETSTIGQNISSQNPSDNICLQDDSNKSHIIDKPVESYKPSTEAPSIKTSMEEDKQHKRDDTEPGSHAKNSTHIAEADVQLISGVSAPESESKGGTNLENARSQFQEKKFSRMHDGEVVQVNYKVYIPTRPPALARRKLQR